MASTSGPDHGFQHVDDARLAYLEAGAGPAVLLVHGSLTDGRYWLRSELLPRLADRFRVVAPCRRHNHPNPPSDERGYDAGVDADDLLELIDALGLAAVHLLGHSYGAYAALIAATRAPARVRSLVLAEPPIMRWLPELPRGQGRWERFEEGVWRGIGEAFHESEEAGLEATARWYFRRPFAEIETHWREAFMDSVREWRALARSDDAYPFVPFEDVAALRIPTLLLSGGKNAGGFNDVIDEHLAATIPGARRVVVEGASHEMFLDEPELVAETVASFFDGA